MAVASSTPQWNTVVGGAQDQNVGEEGLDQRHLSVAVIHLVSLSPQRPD